MHPRALCRLLLLTCGGLASLAAPGWAEDFVTENVSIDLTNPDDAGDKAQWQPEQQLSATVDGLGWESGGARGRLEGWIKTNPTPLTHPSSGLSMQLRVGFSTVIAAKNQRLQVYWRHAPDRVHWSNWQRLPAVKTQPFNLVDRAEPIAVFEGTASIPQKQHDAYRELRQRYAEKNTFWRKDNDQEAAIRWIVKQDPEYFARQVPFFGYVEFLVKTEFLPGQRLQRLQIEMSARPSEETVANSTTPSFGKKKAPRKWSYEAKSPTGKTLK